MAGFINSLKLVAMEITFSNIILVGTTVCTALMAGLFFSYSCSVMPALKTLPDNEFIMTMQAINKAIQNPVFFLVFFGCLVLLPVCCYLIYSSPPTPVFFLVLASFFVYISGVFGTTAFGNIPLNNALEKFDLAAASKDAIAAQRIAFENRWNTLNNLRTAASIVSLVLLVIACINVIRK